MQIPNAFYLIIDLEATCSNDGSVPRHEMEIIEIGAVLQNARTFEIESEFQTFVRPVRHPRLTAFCTGLTSITQEQVDAAPTFPEALQAMRKWMDGFEDALFCSWGDYDRFQFLQDCQDHGVAYPFLTGHLNLKEAFSKSLNTRRRFGVDGALRKLGLELEGTHHRALDDARNIARIVRAVAGAA
ncbi:MAG TPA: 3'-5' exonuclease [Thermoanaerobaculia bacterium]|nr:3'-5' exonuclease [Thermoanaerobaculia bacterium]